MIGIFGGTFDPPHLGHRILAVEALEIFNLEKVLWVLTASPPHKPKRAGASLQARIDLVTMAIAEEEGFEFSRADIDRPAPHYALGTVRWLKERHVDEAFLYLLGEDSLRDLPSWYESETFLDEIDILAVVPRPGVDTDLDLLEQRMPGLAEKIRFIHAPMVQISSSDIRRRIREGRPYHHLLLPEIAEQIKKNKLYLADL